MLAENTAEALIICYIGFWFPDICHRDTRLGRYLTLISRVQYSQTVNHKVTFIQYAIFNTATWKCYQYSSNKHNTLRQTLLPRS
jgi:hypothetical protein